MKLIDTHTHLYLEDFKDDIDKVMKRAFNVGVEKFYIPSKGEWVTLKVTTSTLKTIDKKGISEVMKIAKEKGLL